MTRRIRRATALAALSLAAAPSAHAARPLDTGFFDPALSAPLPETAARFSRAQRVGAGIVRIDVGWPARQRPQNPTDPADPAYDWTRADAAVRAATSHGMAVMAGFTGAPAWAEGAGRPASADPGSWKPDPVAMGAYGEALARRYDGTHVDASGAPLPRVTAFQGWNEPNLALYLSPQWTRTGSRWVNTAAVHYRAMMNAFANGVRRAQPRALIVSAGTAPFGDPGHGRRTMPVRFWRTVLARDAEFDVLDHHPYSVRSPVRHALNDDDVTTPDMVKLTRVLRDARRRGTITGSKRLWATEISYDSSPPDPDGVPAATHARWLAQSFAVLWRQRVDTVMWFQVDDQVPKPSYAATYQSGVYFHDGRPKRAARAFRFPLAVFGRSEVWVRSPIAGTLRIETRRGGRWRTAATRTVKAGAVLDLRLDVAGSSAVRARVGGETSLAWRLTP